MTLTVLLCHACTVSCKELYLWRTCRFGAKSCIQPNISLAFAKRKTFLVFVEVQSPLHVLSCQGQGHDKAQPDMQSCVHELAEHEVEETLLAELALPAPAVDAVELEDARWFHLTWLERQLSGSGVVHASPV